MWEPANPLTKVVESLGDPSNPTPFVPIKGFTLHHVHSKPTPRPRTLPSLTTQVETGHGHMWYTVTYQNDTPAEVFAKAGESNPELHAQCEALGRLVSTALRAGVDVESIIDSLSGIDCGHGHWEGGGRQVKSIWDGAAIALKMAIEIEPPELVGVEHDDPDLTPEFVAHANEIVTRAVGRIGDKEKAEQWQTDIMDRIEDANKGTITLNPTNTAICPKCSGSMYRSGGCLQCPECGFNNCDGSD